MIASSMKSVCCTPSIVGHGLGVDPSRSWRAPSPTPPSSRWAASARQCRWPHLPRSRSRLPATYASPGCTCVCAGFGVNPNRQPSSACLRVLLISDCARFWMLLTWDAPVFGPLRWSFYPLGSSGRSALISSNTRAQGRRFQHPAARPPQAAPPRRRGQPAPRPRSATGRRQTGQGTHRSRTQSPSSGNSITRGDRRR